MDDNCNCTMTDTINYLKGEIVELKNDIKEHSRDMTLLKESHIETKLYVKQIFDSLASLSSILKGITDKPNKRWEQVINTAITVVITAALMYLITK